MNTKKFFEETLDKVKNLGIDSVFSAYGFAYKSSNRIYYHASCPFHNGNVEDKDASIHLGYNTFKCFFCEQDEALSPINLIMLKTGYNFVDTVMDIALRTNSISTKEYDDYYKYSKKKKPLSQNIQITPLSEPIQRRRIILKPRADVDTLNKVYSIFIQGNSLNGGNILSAEHLEYLKGRGLTEEDIVEGKYFTIPSQNIMNSLISNINNLYDLNENVLENIPGFYKDKNGKFTFKYYNAIGIPIFDANKNCKGVQLRLNKEIHYTKKNGKPSTLRYIWLSSDDVPEGCQSGLGPGTPVGVIYPKTDKSTWSKNIFITEGFFKAQQLSKFTNAIVLSVQGVGNWRDSIDEIKTILSEFTDLKRLFICYDADIAYKPQVNNHASNMASCLSEEFSNIEIFYCLWDPTNGKGIDDLIFNNGTNSIKLVKKSIYDNLYKMVIRNTSNMGFKFEDLDDDVKLQIFIECIYNRAKKL